LNLPFGFLAGFVFTPQTLPFTDKEIMDLDKDLARFEQVFLDVCELRIDVIAKGIRGFHVAECDSDLHDLSSSFLRPFVFVTLKFSV
jgi:hypothetical protein